MLYEVITDIIDMEKAAMSRETETELKSRGYHIRTESDFGRMDALYRLRDGRISGCSDPRGYGAAVAEW